jgi:AraC-like DNA-binding protein
MKTKKKIPGEFEVAPPKKEESQLLAELRPYVRQSAVTWRKPWIIKERKILDYLIVFVPEGNGVFSIENEIFEISDNSLFWTPPDTLTEMRGTSTMMRCLHIHFDLLYDPARSHWDASIPGGTKNLKEFKDIMHPPVRTVEINELKGLIKLDNHALIANLFEEICHVHNRFRNNSMLKLSGMMLELIDEILKQKKNADKQGCSRIMLEAAACICENFNENLSVKKLAKKFNMSESHFRKLFREAHNISPSEMHRRSRIKKACDILSFGTHNISETAELLGFSGIHSFSRAFKEVALVSPSEFMRGKMKN